MALIEATSEVWTDHEDAFPCTLERECPRPAAWAVQADCPRHKTVECLACDEHWDATVQVIESGDHPQHGYRCGRPLANVRARPL